MNFRNKKLVATIRTLVGLFMIFSGVSGFMAVANGLEGIPADMLANTQMLLDTGIFQLIKTTEIIGGLLLLLNFRPALGLLIMAPIPVGVVIVNALTAPSYVITGVILGLLFVYLGYVYWDKYRLVFVK